MAGDDNGRPTHQSGWGPWLDTNFARIDRERRESEARVERLIEAAEERRRRETEAVESRVAQLCASLGAKLDPAVTDIASLKTKSGIIGAAAGIVAAAVVTAVVAAIRAGH
jgi:hypothetical protein